ncbi:hypothetical protein ACD982_04075 [Escherichia coli]
MMNIEELRKIFCEDGLYAVCVENGNLVSHYRIMCLRKNGAALINFVDARVTDGFILRGAELPLSNTVPPEKTDGTQRKILQF